MESQIVVMKKTENFNMRVSPDFTEIIDGWRRRQRDIPARAEAIRRLVEAALVAGEYEQVAAQAFDLLERIADAGSLDDRMKAEALEVLGAVKRFDQEKLAREAHGG
ncbi:MAG: hypothetical protein PW843_27405 [Azospirillaceae bacterium]|nr:hypothetical protein [Azospirillaceae bacterium]